MPLTQTSERLALQGKRLSNLAIVLWLNDVNPGLLELLTGPVMNRQTDCSSLSAMIVKCRRLDAAVLRQQILADL